MSAHSVTATMLLARLHHPVRNLGYGTRAGIWFQGCTIGCRGCVSRDTWRFAETARCRVDEVVGWLRGLPAETDGVTISGGEPTDQPEALRHLLAAIDGWRAERHRPLDVLVYSGRSIERIDAAVPWLRHAVDVLISEPFVAELAGDDALRGSSNQRVHLLTELGACRYPRATLQADYAGQRRHMGVHVVDGGIRMVGIPLPGDLARLDAVLAARGIDTDRRTWTT